MDDKELDTDIINASENEASVGCPESNSYIVASALSEHEKFLESRAKNWTLNAAAKLQWIDSLWEAIAQARKTYHEHLR